MVMDAALDDMGEIIQEFLVESHENLDQLDHDLVELEQDPGSRDLLSSVFRTIHTIKGTSGFLAFHQLESVTHVGESLLSRLRDGEIAMTPRVTSGLLDMVDAVRALLGDIERTGAEGTHDHAVLIALLTALQEGKQAAAEEPPLPTPSSRRSPGSRRRPSPSSRPSRRPRPRTPTATYRPMRAAASRTARSGSTSTSSTR
jgi:two-component system chemotaxis sensor kinase CheA